MTTTGTSHLLEVLAAPRMLHRMMEELAGDSRLSLEGNLSKCRFEENWIVSYEELPPLMRGTSVPRQHFIVLRLIPEFVEPIYEQIMKAEIRRSVIHIQIERNGVLELGAYDNFHADCVVTGPGVSEALLIRLKDDAILRSFKAAPP